MRKTAIFRDKLFVEHRPGFDHIERPERLSSLYSSLAALPERDLFLEPQFTPAPRKTILLNHTASHIDTVAATAEKIFSVLDADTVTSEKSFAAALLAAGAATRAIDMLYEGIIDNGLALVRPPGHHAEQGRAMGFCLFNNVALAARHAIREYGVKRIFIVDWDVHHGNGTQNAFYDTDEVLFISLHQSPLYPGSGGFTESGVGRGTGFTVNIPMPGGQGDLEYALIFNTVVAPLCRQYQPELILVSAGFDACYADPLSSMRLTHQGFAYMTRVLTELAEEFCNGRLFLCLEGGYDLAGLKGGVFAVLGELLGEKLTTPFPCSLHPDTAHVLRKSTGPHPISEKTRHVVKKYWKM